MTTLESLGLLITLTLGGLGMFLVVLTVTFVFAKMVTKPSDFERLGDQAPENYEYEEEYLESLVHNERKEVFVIEDVEGCILEKDDTRAEEESNSTLTDDTSKLRRIRNVWQSILTGRLKENIFGSKFIELHG